MDHATHIRDELRDEAVELRKEIPEVLRAFADLSRAAMADGELSSITKEFAALAIAIAEGCDGCIVAHVRGLIRLGATRHQVAELAGVAVLMSGGPGTVWGPRALAAFDQLTEESMTSDGSPKR